jgi:hypothetical protein
MMQSFGMSSPKARAWFVRTPIGSERRLHSLCPQPFLPAAILLRAGNGLHPTACVLAISSQTVLAPSSRGRALESVHDPRPVVVSSIKAVTHFSRHVYLYYPSRRCAYPWILREERFADIFGCRLLILWVGFLGVVKMGC